MGFTFKAWKGVCCAEGLLLSGWSGFMRSNLRDSKKIHSSPKLPPLQTLKMSASASIPTCPSCLSTIPVRGQHVKAVTLPQGWFPLARFSSRLCIGDIGVQDQSQEIQRSGHHCSWPLEAPSVASGFL